MMRVENWVPGGRVQVHHVLTIGLAFVADPPVDCTVGADIKCASPEVGPLITPPEGMSEKEVGQGGPGHHGGVHEIVVGFDFCFYRGVFVEGQTTERGCEIGYSWRAMVRVAERIIKGRFGVVVGRDLRRPLGLDHVVPVPEWESECGVVYEARKYPLVEVNVPPGNSSQ